MTTKTRFYTKERDGDYFVLNELTDETVAKCYDNKIAEVIRMAIEIEANKTNGNTTRTI